MPRLWPIVLLALLWPSSARSEVPIEGDAGLLATLVDAQRTNLSRLSRGRVKAKASDSASGREAEATVVWDPGGTYWDYSLWEMIPEPDGTKRKVRHVVEMIETPEELAMYWKETATVYRHPPGLVGYHEVLRVRPDQVWFHSVSGRDFERLWAEAFDASRGFGTLRKYVVRREGDEVLVDMHFERGTVLHVTASLALGGNVTEFATALPDGTGFDRRGVYEWERHPGGVYWPRHLEMWVTHDGPPGHPRQGSHFTLDVTEFDPNPVIPKGRFTLASFRLPKGTRVVESKGQGNPREYYVGGKAINADLDRLADEVRREGFAAPGRAAE